MKSLEQAIADGWGWAVKAPVAVIATNDFGNAVICDSDGKYFRIIPEDLAYIFLTEDTLELTSIMDAEEFQVDWAMQPLRRNSEEAHGPLEHGQCYHLVTPSVLGGTYTVDNVRRISIIDWLGGAGSIARITRWRQNHHKAKIKCEPCHGPNALRARIMTDVRRKQMSSPSTMLQSQFNSWLDKALSQPIDPSVVAFSFNLAEPWCIEVIGSESYSEVDSDWACDEVFRSPGSTILKKSTAVTVGFVDGDLHKVWPE